MITSKDLHEELTPHIKYVQIIEMGKTFEGEVFRMVEKPFVDQLIARLADAERDAERWRYLFSQNAEIGKLIDTAQRRGAVRELLAKASVS
jgi:hypothetical protein